jgi:hypothetical protein
MRLLIKQSELMQMATFVPMGVAQAPDLQDQVWQPHPAAGQGGHAAPALRIGSSPTSRPWSWMRKLFKAEVHLSDEVLEDNIEQATLQQTILDMIAEAAGRDMEDIVINGDKNLRGARCSRCSMGS